MVDKISLITARLYSVTAPSVLHAESAVHGADHGQFCHFLGVDAEEGEQGTHALRLASTRVTASMLIYINCPLRLIAPTPCQLCPTAGLPRSQRTAL